MINVISILFLLSSFNIESSTLRNISYNLESFNVIYKYYSIELTCSDCKSIEGLDLIKISTINNYFKNRPSLVSSSFIVKQNKDYNISMTSDHVCKSLFSVDVEKKDKKEIYSLIEKNISNKDFKFYRIVSEIFIESRLKKRTKVLKVIKSDSDNDICTFLTKNITGYPVSLEKKKSLIGGDFLYSITSMFGIRADNGFLIYTGTYAGLYEKRSFLSTLYSKPGSSGSPVFNKDGNLVGVIHTTFNKINNISISTNLKHVKNLIINSNF